MRLYYKPLNRKEDVDNDDLKSLKWRERWLFYCSSNHIL